MSIRLRLTLWHTALLAIVLVGVALLVYAVAADQISRRFDVTLQERAADVQPTLLAYRSLNRQPSKHPTATCTPEQAHVAPSDLLSPSLNAELIDYCGNVDVRSANLAQPLPIPADDRVRALNGQPVLTSVTTPSGRERVFGQPVPGDNHHLPSAIFVAMPLAPLAADLRNLKLALAAIVVGTLALTAAMGWFLAAKAMRPVDRMTRAAQAIGAAQDFSRRLPDPASHDEIGRLARTFNEMLSRLALAFTTQRRFLADASHELRTPLTAIRANVDALLRGAGSDPAEREETLRAIAREADRMGRLVDDLLTLARADAGQEPVRQRLALDALLLDIYHQQRALAGGVKLTLGDFEPLEVEGDPDRLKQLVLNLVDNALRHTPPGGTVTLDLAHRRDEATLRVRDTGPGIPPEHLPRIFERFYRVDAARARLAGGAGLGLAISREIADAHGGRIEVESQVGAGSTFTVVLPSLPSAVTAPVPEPALPEQILTSA